MEVYGEFNTPCASCKPEIHEYNYDALVLFNSCSDQYISGPSGPISLNDIAINNAMDRYFTVAKKDRLALSLKVRRYFKEMIGFLNKDSDE